ncbi:hypothetical protein [Mucilaginibacter sp.]|uniref:hypothetical protein n=1 Tax=Mucilaginibacter sp. TaxID=1882438 RepID=UPI00284F8B3B|nr:hypothetical protein [Mucilaginibacter sp.]MDR3695645.1 hypothetical protein [Mucilaginibacter sp.]
MKKISLIILIAGMIWTVQTAQAQTQDTTKNSIEVKKKVKKGAHGRTVTKIKMTGTGTPDAINGAADGAVTGHLKPAPAPAPIVVTPPPAPEPPAPTVVVVHDTVRTPAPVVAPVVPPAPTTTEVTTTTETKPVVTAATHHTTHTYHKPVHTYHKTYKKTAAAASATKTTTTTTVKKTE